MHYEDSLLHWIICLYSFHLIFSFIADQDILIQNRGQDPIRPILTTPQNGALSHPCKHMYRYTCIVTSLYTAHIRRTQWWGRNYRPCRFQPPDTLVWSNRSHYDFLLIHSDISLMYDIALFCGVVRIGRMRSRPRFWIRMS